MVSSTFLKQKQQKTLYQRKGNFHNGHWGGLTLRIPPQKTQNFFLKGKDVTDPYFNFPVGLSSVHSSGVDSQSQFWLRREPFELVPHSQIRASKLVAPHQNPMKKKDAENITRYVVQFKFLFNVFFLTHASFFFFIFPSEIFVFPLKNFLELTHDC